MLKKTNQRVKIGRWNKFWYKIKRQNGMIGWVYGAFIKSKLRIKTKYRVTNDPILNNALFEAIRENEVSKVLIYLKNGADPNSNGPYHKVLIHAIKWKKTKLVKILLDHGAYILKLPELTYNNQGPLITAINNNSFQIAVSLINAGLNVQETSSNGETALSLAAKKGKINLVKLLIARGIRINSLASYGTSPLHAAISNNYLKIVNLLISAGIDVNLHGESDNTPLSLAIQEEKAAIVKLLRAAGARE